MESELERIAREINELRRREHTRQVESALAMGKRLKDARRLLAEGEWTAWVRQQVRFSLRTAANLIALAQFHENQPETFEKLAVLGLSKLYRIAELPTRFLKKLRPQSVLKVPGAGVRKTLGEMSPVELNCCVRRWTHRSVHRKPNQTAQMSARLADKLRAALDRLSPRMDRVRVELRESLRQQLEALESGLRACLLGLKRASPAA